MLRDMYCCLGTKNILKIPQGTDKDTAKTMLIQFIVDVERKEKLKKV
jgi:hypothetical protein